MKTPHPVEGPIRSTFARAFWDVFMCKWRQDGMVLGALVCTSEEENMMVDSAFVEC